MPPGVHEGVLDPPDPGGIVGVEGVVGEVGLVGPEVSRFAVVSSGFLVSGVFWGRVLGGGLLGRVFLGGGVLGLLLVVRRRAFLRRRGGGGCLLGRSWLFRRTVHRPRRVERALRPARQVLRRRTEPRRGHPRVVR
ncbi:hypothetical protein CF165_02735 [Amycolatopsis vastitatis]|uniref:Uncharacterized protein n=1 Tax=Amycolatopsis vastitatis TaxID=1905142 RepID=A0A229TIN5_9PSEU|nr:hypothetical protein CF165_02735 [Amycolatopsis vastitatis]